ncbi:MAG: DUF192 domain-containing protein [Phycisphaeraceae bacterium]|nr:DUF192 domain-containing protein [Phycisphaeraceae bacterium]
MARLTSPLTVLRTMMILVVIGSAAILPGCDEKAGADVAPATIAGKKFFLEIVADNDSRMKGLMHRDHIDDDGGMIFVFPFPDRQAFWMGNCEVDMDILYLDSSGRVVSTAEMKKERPRGPDETEQQYDARMPRYPSRFAAQFAIEVQAGMVKRLGVKAGDLVQFDHEGLKKRAK